MGRLSFEAIESHLMGVGYSLKDVRDFRRRFEACPDVWREFEAMTLRLISEGKKAGAVDILARIRWERIVEQRLTYKCNNNDAPIYARIFAVKYPQHNHFFNYRRVG